MSVTTAQLLADLRQEVHDRGHSRISELLSSTASRHHDPLPLNSVSPRERETTTMNIDPNIYGYQYNGSLYCAEDMIETLIEDGRAAPAARELPVETVLDQIAETEALSTAERADSLVIPQPLGAYAGLDEDDICETCLEVLYA